MKAYNIKWDTDYYDDVNLPSDVDIPKWLEDDEDAISDWLSDTFGFCHKGFDLR